MSFLEQLEAAFTGVVVESLSAVIFFDVAFWTRDAEVPLVGRDITCGEPFMSLESGKWVGRVKAVVTGKILEANEEIEWESTIINEDPYGEGWFAKVELGGEPSGLLKANDPEFAKFIAAEREKYGK